MRPCIGWINLVQGTGLQPAIQRRIKCRASKAQPPRTPPPFVPPFVPSFTAPFDRSHPPTQPAQPLIMQHAMPGTGRNNAMPGTGRNYAVPGTGRNIDMPGTGRIGRMQHHGHSHDSIRWKQYVLVMF